MSDVLALFGGRSEIGLELVGRLASGAVVVLAVRPGADADEARRACLAAGATRVEVVAFDADDISAQPAAVEAIEAVAGPITHAVLAFGVLGDQALAERDHREVVRVLHTDFVAQASLLTVLAGRMRPWGRGTLVAFSSVAGVRVRRPNYVYGSAKAGLDGFVTGLADALRGTGIDVVLARPGFVVGRMTEGLAPAVFSSTPAEVADALAERIRAGRGPTVVWIPWKLRPLFAVARVVPAALWRRVPR